MISDEIINTLNNFILMNLEVIRFKEKMEKMIKILEFMYPKEFKGKNE